MEILEGKKYRKRRTEKSIMDIKVNDSYTIYVFKGVKEYLSPNDFLVQYSKNGGRARTPKHIHWVIDMLLKEQKNHNDVIAFIKCMQKIWDEIVGLKSNDYITLRDTLLKYKNKVDKEISRLTLEGRRVSN